VVKVGRALGEVLDQQIPDLATFDALPVDDLLDAAATVQSQHPQPFPGHCGEPHRFSSEQRSAGAVPEVVLLKCVGQLDSVARQ
jgi:hypothetical protein